MKNIFFHLFTLIFLELAGCQKFYPSPGQSIAIHRQFIEAAASGDLTTVESLWNRYQLDINWVDSRELKGKGCFSWTRSFTAIHRVLACNSTRSTQVLKWLLDQGADLDKRQDYDYGMKPIHLAVRAQKNIENVRLLLDTGKKRGYNLGNSLTDYNYSPLMYAIWGGRLDIVTVLIDEHNANVTYQRPDDWLTPLMVAAEANRDSANGTGVEILEFLLKTDSLKGNYAAINAKRKPDDRFVPSWTAMTLAAWYGYENKLKLLLENGADKSLGCAPQCFALKFPLCRQYVSELDIRKHCT